MGRWVFQIMVVLLWGVSWSQEPGALGTVFRGGHVAVANDYAATYWNPAGLAFGQGLMLGAMVQRLPLEREFSFVSAVFMLNRYDRLAFSWSGMTVSNLEARQGNTASPERYFCGLEQEFWLSYAYRLSRRFSLGINGRFLYSQLDEATGYGYAADFGIMCRVDRRIRVGLSVREFISQLLWPSGHVEQLGRRVTLAGSFRHGVLLAALAMEAGAGGRLWLCGGIEYRALNMIRIRLGTRNDRPAVGLGFDFRVDNMRASLGMATAFSPVTGELSHACDLSVGLRRR